MKYLTGYLTALILGAITWALGQLASRYSALVDMVYPYVTRTVQEGLAQWSSEVNSCLWQVFLLLMVLGVIAALVMIITMHWRPIRLGGWVLAGFSLLFLLNTVLLGLNVHAGSIADDIRMDVYTYTVDELADATIYYRDKANDLAVQMERDDKGELLWSDFETLANQAGQGFDTLVQTRSFSVFGGSTLPVKKLGWSGIYNALGVTGVTVGLTGEAAVNPKIPVVSQPFTMCREMAHRMCILAEGDSNFAAFLAAVSNESLEFQYSAYYMAYRYCYDALTNAKTNEAKAAAEEIDEGVCDQLRADLDAYKSFFRKHVNEKATHLAETTSDTLHKLSGTASSDHAVSDLLVSWHYQQVVLPTMMEEEVEFDPLDESQVDLTTTQIPVETEPPTEEATTGE